MITTHKINSDEVDYMKGAAEKVLERCKYYWHSGKVIRLTVLEKERILDQASEMGSKALRVLAMAYSKDKYFVFVGLVGMIDPPRKEVKEAIETARKAGIETIMVTGDHKSTAVAIGNLIGIKGKVVEGKDLERISENELRKLVKEVKIFARVDSAHKVMILEALQKNGEVVAMTGDGVNDAPALKKADVGVSMSIKGTDVARNASDMVLVDDNYASIVGAVKEGRVIYDNIKKFVKFLLSANFDEVAIILFSLIIGLPLPLIPLQILWLNLVTDSFPALALSVDPGERGVMKRKPRNKKEHILSNTIGFIITAGMLAAIVSFGIFMLEYFGTGNLMKARTLALTTSIFFELFFVFSCRSDKESIFKLKINKWLIGAVLLSALLHIGLIYGPFADVFKLVQLNLMDWGKIILLSLSGFMFFEVRKLIKR
jgi:Ca2+-transporting ATPase